MRKPWIPAFAGMTAMWGAEFQSLPEGVHRVARLLREQGHPHLPVVDVVQQPDAA